MAHQPCETNSVVYVMTLQYAAEITFDMVSPGPSVRQRKRRQPADLREGVANAYKVVSEVYF